MTTPPRPLKILHIMARLNIGGTTPYIIQLIVQQRQMGHDSRLVCGMVGPQEGDMRYLADEKGIELTMLTSLGREISPVRDVRTLWELWQIIRRERPDVVHTHTAKAGFVGRIAAWLARVPTIVHTFHGHVFAGYFSPAKTQLYLWIERFCGLLSTKIIVLSAALKRELSEQYHVANADNFAIVPLGFDLTPFVALDHDDGAFRAKIGVPMGAPLIGIVGRLVAIKNHAMFLRAAALILKEIPDAYFVLVGDGDQRELLTALVAELGLQERVKFAGWITDLPLVYRALDTTVCSSINEGLPVSLIEAMAAGVPIVATRVGGVPDLLEEGKLGAIVPLDDAALAEAVIAAVKAGKQAPQVQTARQTALARYSIETSATLTEQLYRNAHR
jgi:glycosyltransferase involved in cell wall biosynthesis